MLYACTTLFRGAGYVSFDGELPEQPLHGAMNAAYAHATAPLRRLVDRYVGALCEALCAGDPVPEWIRAELDELPKTMQQATQRSNAYERGLLDLVEALVLAPHVGSPSRASSPSGRPRTTAARFSWPSRLSPRGSPGARPSAAPRWRPNW